MKKNEFSREKKTALGWVYRPKPRSHTFCLNKDGSRNFCLLNRVEVQGGETPVSFNPRFRRLHSYKENPIVIVEPTKFPSVGALMISFKGHCVCTTKFGLTKFRHRYSMLSISIMMGESNWRSAVCQGSMFSTYAIRMGDYANEEMTEELDQESNSY